MYDYPMFRYTEQTPNKSVESTDAPERCLLMASQSTGFIAPMSLKDEGSCSRRKQLLWPNRRAESANDGRVAHRVKRQLEIRTPDNPEVWLNLQSRTSKQFLG